MRLKFITVMQTPPKDRGSDFHYNEPMLIKGIEKACEIETAIYKLYPKDEDRAEKFKSLYYILQMKYTEFKVRVLSGDISPEELIKMSPEDFLSAEEKQKREAADQEFRDSQRTDWFRAQMAKGPKTDGFFQCKQCGSKNTDFY